jgi:hypothetical protein
MMRVFTYRAPALCQWWGFLYTKHLPYANDEGFYVLFLSAHVLSYLYYYYSIVLYYYYYTTTTYYYYYTILYYYYTTTTALLYYYCFWHYANATALTELAYCPTITTLTVLLLLLSLSNWIGLPKEIETELDLTELPYCPTTTTLTINYSYCYYCLTTTAYYYSY